MAIGESAGSVYVTIDGDASPLAAKFAQAEAMSRAAGQGVAQGFAAGAAGPNAASTSVDRLTSVISTEASAASSAVSANAALAGGIRQVGAASEGATVKMYQASAAIRTAFGETSIRAVERLTTMIPGLSTLFANAFPIFGLIQLGLMFGKATEKSEELKAAEKELEDQNRKLDESFNETAKTIYRVAAESQARNFGPAAGTAERIKGINDEGRESQRVVEQLKMQIKEVAATAASDLQTHPWRTYSSDAEVAKDKIKALGDQIEQQFQKQKQLAIERSGLQELQGTQLQEQGGQIGVKRIEAEEEANVRAGQISKQRYDAEIDAAHAAQQQRIAGLESEYARVVATGQEEIAFEKAKEDEIAGYALATRDRTIKEIAAKAAAESAGKSAPEQALIQTGARADTQKAKDEFALASGKAALDVQKSQQDATLKLDELNQKLAQTLANDVREGWEKVDAAARKAGEVSQEATTKDLEAKTRIAEIQDKSAGDVKALQTKQQEIELEGKYESQASHTLAQRVAYLRQIADLEGQANAEKLKGLEADLADAQALSGSLRDETRIASLQAEIAQLKQQGINQQAQTANQIGVAQRQASFGTQLGNAGTQGLSSLSSALAKGVVDGGKGLGKDIRQSLQGIGREMLGDAIKTGVEDMVIAITGNTIATNLNTLWTEVLTLVSKIPFFAEGTGSAPGGTALVGEKGPEIVHLPRGSQVIPNHKINKYADGTPGWGGRSTHYHSTAFQTGTTNLTFHVHGQQNPDRFVDHVMRKLPETLKRRSSQFASLSH